MSFTKGFEKHAGSVDWKGLASNVGKMAVKNKKPLMALGGAAAVGYVAGKNQEKTAAQPIPGSFGHGLGKILGKTKKFVREDVGQTVQNLKQRAANVKGGIEAGAGGARKNFTSGLRKRAPGETLAARRAEKIQSGHDYTPEQKAKIQTNASSAAKTDLGDRQKRLLEHKNKAKTNQGFAFARKHPVATGLASAYVAHKVLSSDQGGNGSPQAGNPVSPY